MYFAGIDVGSRTTKAVLLDRAGNVVSFDIRETGVRGQEAAEKAYDVCLENAGTVSEKIVGIVSTGYGKKKVSLASKHLTEITCHALGANHLIPDTRTVIDIGGEDSKVILLNGSGAVLDFAMNDRCAAGTGRFLEFMARVLDLEIFQMAGIPHDPDNTTSINSLCTVFAESEIISFLAEGCPVENIVRGLHASVAARISALLKRIPFVSPVTLSGGVAKNRGVVAAMENRLQLTLNIPQEPQIIGAVGAACAARKKALEDSRR